MGKGGKWGKNLGYYKEGGREGCWKSFCVGFLGVGCGEGEDIWDENWEERGGWGVGRGKVRLS